MYSLFKQYNFIRQLYCLAFATIIVFIVGDISRRYALFLNLEFTRQTLITKLFVLIMYLLFFAFHIKRYIKNKKTKHILLLILGLLFVFILSNIVFPIYGSFNINNVEFLVRYLFFPITMMVFYEMFEYKYYIDKLFKLYEYIFLINATLIIVSFVLEMNLFKTYPNIQRFGYSGIFNRSIQAVYLTILMLAAYYYSAYILKKKNAKIKFIIALFSALLIGAKTLYFAVFSLLAYSFFKKKLTKKTIAFIFSLIFFLLIFKDELIQLFLKNFGLFLDIYYDKGLLTAITSHRDILLLKTFNEEVLPNWTWYNILIGGSDFTIIRPEIDTIDIFLFFGAFGAIIYFNIIMHFTRTLESISTFMRSSLIFTVILTFLTNGFFNSVNIPLLFFIITYHMHFSETIKQDTKNENSFTENIISQT